MTDATGSTQWTYTALGRIASKTEVDSYNVGAGVVPGGTYVTSYTYNAAGQLASMTYPSGSTVNFTYNTNNQVSALSVTIAGVTTTIASNIQYEPFGAVRSWTWGTGGLATRTRDADGNVTAISTGGLHWTLGYDNAFRITSQTDLASAANNWTFGFDSLDRLTSGVKVASNTNYAWTYDANGNRLSHSYGTVVQNYTYAQPRTSNRATVVDWYTNLKGLTDKTPLTIPYDAAGNVTQRNGLYTPGLPIKVDAEGNAGSPAPWFYVTNGLRQRTIVSDGSAEVFRIVYDENSHIVGEYYWVPPGPGLPNGFFEANSETVFLGDLPIAVLSGQRTYDTQGNVTGYTQLLRYAHADQLGTTRRLTVAATGGANTWSWNSEPFGRNSAGGTDLYDWRFPGQIVYPDGNFYNYYRDYDQWLGRYLQSDPIGLDGGSMSTYSYVNDDPLDYIDPEGLAGSGAPRRRVRDCNSDEWTQCEAQCAGKGVRSCKRQQIFQPVRTTNRNGTVLTTYIWKDQGLSCDCRDPEACKNAVQKAAAALGLSVTTYLIISEGSRLFPPRNLVPVP